MFQALPVMFVKHDLDNLGQLIFDESAVRCQDVAQSDYHCFVQQEQAVEFSSVVNVRDGEQRVRDVCLVRVSVLCALIGSLQTIQGYVELDGVAMCSFVHAPGDVLPIHADHVAFLEQRSVEFIRAIFDLAAAEFVEELFRDGILLETSPYRLHERRRVVQEALRLSQMDDVRNV